MNTFNRVMVIGILLGIVIASAVILLANTKCATLFGTGVCVW